MKFKQGQDRVVVVFPSIGIAIKLPIVRFWSATRLLYRFIKGGHWGLLKKYCGYPVEGGFDGFRGLFFRGLFANLGEFRFYWQTRNPFLQPTYFSLFGLLNIQRAGEQCLLKDEDLWCQLVELTREKVFDDSHHFANPENFCFSNGKLRMLDYGSRDSHGVIALYGVKIVELFDPAYCWEEEKKKIIAKREASK